MLRTDVTPLFLVVGVLFCLTACGTPSSNGSLYIDGATVKLVESSNYTLLMNDTGIWSYSWNDEETVVQAREDFALATIERGTCLTRMINRSGKWCDDVICNLDPPCQFDGARIRCEEQSVDCRLDTAPNWSTFTVDSDSYTYGLYRDGSVNIIHRHEESNG